MDNAAKALLIAGGILIALLIISVMVFGLSSITEFAKSNEEKTRNQQIMEFNNEFKKYDRDNVRGTDILSLINRVIDNNKNSEFKKANETYQAIQLTIKIPTNKYNNTYMGRFKNEESDTNFINGTYTITGTTAGDIQTLLTNIKGYEDLYAGGNAAIMENLVSNISTIVSDTDEALNKYNSIAKKKITGTGTEEWRKAKEAISNYYQFVYFKRARFNCTKLEYNNETTKISNIEFEWNGRFE